MLRAYRSRFAFLQINAVASRSIAATAGALDSLSSAIGAQDSQQSGKDAEAPASGPLAGIKVSKPHSLCEVSCACSAWVQPRSQRGESHGLNS